MHTTVKRLVDLRITQWNTIDRNYTSGTRRALVGDGFVLRALALTIRAKQLKFASQRLGVISGRLQHLLDLVDLRYGKADWPCEATSNFTVRASVKDLPWFDTALAQTSA